MREDEPIDDDADELDIPIHAFDVIIADECHRGYTSAKLSVWRKTLDHFDAIKIGLTATPAAHTKAYFNDSSSATNTSARSGRATWWTTTWSPSRSDVRHQRRLSSEGEQVGIIDPTTGS